jgi:ribosomal protein S18 acetylase RimI-like enzyme
VIDYRYAALPDVPAVVALVESAYRGEESQAGWTSEAHLIGGQRTDAEMISGVLAATGAHVLLAEEAGALQACCELREPKPAGHAAYFGMFAVRPSVQRSGYGRMVLAEAERIARDEFGATTLEMTVIRQRDALVGWYQRRGYEPTGEVRPFPYGNDRYGEPKVNDLEFAILAKAVR